MYTFEICANSVESCIAAQQGGAHRVELCDAIELGGITPSVGAIMMARELLTIKLHVIIRPRGGDFCYTPLEVAIMKRDIQQALKMGVDGVVIGCLTPEGDIDKKAMEELMSETKGMSVTFHRAFDLCKKPLEALEQIIAMGCDRVLTSGQQLSAEAGVGLLRQLREEGKNRITILPGCGITEKNIATIQQATGCNEFHFSARESFPSAMKYKNPSINMGTPGIDDSLLPVTTITRVKNTIQALDYSL